MPYNVSLVSAIQQCKSTINIYILYIYILYIYIIDIYIFSPSLLSLPPSSHPTPRAWNNHTISIFLYIYTNTHTHTDTICKYIIRTQNADHYFRKQRMLRPLSHLPLQLPMTVHTQGIQDGKEHDTFPR